MKYTKLAISLLSLAFLASCGGTTGGSSNTPTDSTGSTPVESTDSTPVESTDTATDSTTTETGPQETAELRDTMFTSLSKAFSLKGFDHATMYFEGLMETPFSLVTGFSLSFDGEHASSESGTATLVGDTVYTPADIAGLTDISATYISKDDEGNMVASGLGLNNEVISQPVLDSDDQPVAFYENPFSFVYAEDFAATEDFHEAANRKYAFELKADAMERANVLNAFGNFIFNMDIVSEDGEEGVNTTLTFFTDGHEVTGLEMVLGADPYDVTGETGAPSIGERVALDVVAAGDDVAVDTVEAVTAAPDADLDAALKKLAAAKSYTNSLELKDGTGASLDTVSLKATENAVVIEYSDESREAYLNTADGLLVGEMAAGATQYEIADTYAGVTVADALPDLDLSAALFEKQADGSYLLKTDVPGLVFDTTYSLFVNTTNGELVSLSVTLGDDNSVVLTTTVSYGTDSVVYVENYSALDATTVELTEADFVAPAPSIVTMLDDQSFAVLSQHCLSDHLKLIPSVDGYTEAFAVEVSFSDGSTDYGIAVDCGTADNAAAAATAYLAKLDSDENWVAQTEYEGVYSYKDKVSVDFGYGPEEVFFAIQVAANGQYLLIIPGYYSSL